MSRCFPFPPSGYSRRNGSCSEALIESIKLRKDDEMVNKVLKKEKRREKKEKKKERKGIASHSSSKELKLFGLECVRTEKYSACLRYGDYHETEQLERSDITEEHDHPVSWQEPCSSESTQTSNKRKRSVSPSSTQATGIKLRFSLKKHKEPEETSLDDQLGFISRSVGAVVSVRDSNVTQQDLGSVANTTIDQCAGNSDPRHIVNLRSSCQDVPPATKDDESLRVESGYPSILQNWVPLPLTSDGLLSDDHQDWLFEPQKVDSPFPKRVNPISAPTRCLSPSPWPRAQYLPEMELYALPYAVPF